MPRSIKATATELYEMYTGGKTYRQIATEKGLSVDSVRGRIWKYMHQRVQRLPDASPFMMTIGEAHEEALQPLLVPTFSGIPVMRGATIVSGDWHLITTEWTVVKLLIRFAETLPKGQRKLAIIGDFLNLTVLSRYPNYYPPELLNIELEAAAAALDYLLDTFDEIDYLMGNHEARFYKALNGFLLGKQFGRLITKGIERGRLRVSKATQGVVVAGGRGWRVTHQRNYSRNKGIVANRLAQKHQTDAMTFHEHHAAVLRDEFNRYTLINCPSMVDYEKLAYVMQFDSTSPVMCNGFGFIDEDGTGHILTPYASMTSWKAWGLQHDPIVLEAQAAAALKQARLSFPPELLDDLMPKLELVHG